jgi:MFS family permease
VIPRLDTLRTLPTPLLILAAMTFVSSLGISMMLPLLPLYGLALGATPLQLGFMTSGFATANAISQFATGFLNDRFGARRFIASGIATYSVANALIAVAPNAVALIGLRTLAGLGAGANLVSSRIYVSHIAPRDRLSFSNSVLSAAGSAGNVAGPAIGGLLAAAFTLAAPFAAVAATSAIAFVGSLFLPRERAADAHAQAAAGVGPPLVDRPLLVLFVSNLLLSTSFGAWITSYAPFATERLGWTTMEVGLLFTVFAIGDITLGPWLGRLADRTGRKRIAILAGIPVAFFGIALVAAFPRPLLYATAYLAGAGLTAFFSSWFALMTVAVPASRRGRVFGIVSAIGSIGTVAGSLGAAAIWETTDLGLAILLAGLIAMSASLVLILLPTDTKPREAAAATAAAPGN